MNRPEKLENRKEPERIENQPPSPPPNPKSLLELAFKKYTARRTY
jgi:hypothetical protein